MTLHAPHKICTRACTHPCTCTRTHAPRLLHARMRTPHTQVDTLEGQLKLARQDADAAKAALEEATKRGDALDAEVCTHARTQHAHAAHACKHAHTRTHARMHAHTRMCMHLCARVRTHTCAPTCAQHTHARMRAHTHTHTWRARLLACACAHTGEGAEGSAEGLYRCTAGIGEGTHQSTGNILSARVLRVSSCTHARTHTLNAGSAARCIVAASRTAGLNTCLYATCKHHA